MTHESGILFFVFLHLDNGKDVSDGVVGLKFLEKGGTDADEEEGNEAGQADDEQQVVQEGDGVRVHVQPHNLHIGPAQ
jgi:hypothetical protein